MKPKRPKIDTRHTVRKMSDDTYKLRRKAMKFIYEAKALYPSLPRITIRIVDNVQCTDPVLGSAYLGSNTIAITAEVTNRKDLKRTVFHEILHAVFSQQHVEGCSLMDPITNIEISPAELDRLFLKYARSG